MIDPSAWVDPNAVITGDVAPFKIRYRSRLDGRSAGGRTDRPRGPSPSLGWAEQGDGERANESADSSGQGLCITLARACGSDCPIAKKMRQ
jgi:hypothetical protein